MTEPDQTQTGAALVLPENCVGVTAEAETVVIIGAESASGVRLGQPRTNPPRMSMHPLLAPNKPKTAAIGFTTATASVVSQPWF